MILNQRKLRIRAFTGGAIGKYVRTAKRVNRLLRVADQVSKKIGTTKQPREDRILHTIGILKLVDQRGTKSGANLCNERRAAGLDQGRLQSRQQIVERHDVRLLLATRHLVGPPSNQVRAER